MTTSDPINGSFRPGYLILYLTLQHLAAGVLLCTGGFFAAQGGAVGCALAAWFWLLGGYWLLSAWREAYRAVTWFRLDGDSLMYRTLGSRRERVLPLSAVRRPAPYRAARHSTTAGFTLFTDSGRLVFDFYWLSGSFELWQFLQNRTGLAAT
jgi:hypothetical protein